MKIERFIAHRYLIGKKKFSFINIISLLATLGIMFGVAALIVVMSVFNGFNGLVTGIMQDFDPHIKIERVPHVAGMSSAETGRIIKTVSGLTGFAPFIQRKAMAMAKGNNSFVWITGIDAKQIATVSGVKSKMIMGSFSFVQHNGIVLGVKLMDDLRVLVGDTVTIYSPAGMEQILTQFVTPTVLTCPVVGVFDARNKLYDGTYGFVSPETARKLFRLDEEFTGFQLRLDNIARSADVKRDLEGKIGKGWIVSTWYDLHKDLYSMMTMERWGAFILLSIIVAVAVFNILASLTMLVLEKRRDIGILRTMGLAPDKIQRIFLLEGFWIGLIGVFAGLLIGLLICWAQIQFGFFRLDSAFIIPAIPVDVRFSDIALIAAATFGLCLLAAWYPARRARNVEIIDAIRWE
jgi:lipoprotein-releasing system permease protein